MKKKEIIVYYEKSKKNINLSRNGYPSIATRYQQKHPLFDHNFYFWRENHQNKIFAIIHLENFSEWNKNTIEKEFVEKKNFSHSLLRKEEHPLVLKIKMKLLFLQITFVVLHVIFLPLI